jgi:hypothetical protein
VDCACSGRSCDAMASAASWSAAPPPPSSSCSVLCPPDAASSAALRNPLRQVWCVSRHDNVPSYLRKIDTSLSLRSRALSAAGAPRTPAALPEAGLESELGRAPTRAGEAAAEDAEGSGAGVEADREEALVLAEDDALLCLGGDVPMRLAVASVADLQRLAEPGARPRPRLAAAQQRGGWPDGTVLLLGRSGTTDRERAAALGVGLRQLFVAWSPRMCELVRGIQVA